MISTFPPLRIANNMNIKHFLLLILSCPLIVFAQEQPETYDIKYAGDKIAQKCGEYTEVYNKLPVEVRYSTQIKDGYIYFFLPGKTYYELLFDKNTDGIAIDILRRDQYNCTDGNDFPNSWVNKGYLMPPLYKKEMDRNMTVSPEGYVVVQYARLPRQFDPSNIECNLLILQKKYLCAYHAFSNLDFSHWSLLEMGLYRDSLTTDQYNEQYQAISKIQRFTIPFERNKVEFEQADIKPLYDSLELTDYNIKEINIRAYSSVEGTEERNIQLQRGRANSIVQALQAYQSPEINSTITANENWVEFLSDINNSKFSYLTRLSKQEIKSKLSDQQLLQALEPFLKNHRKALVELKLQKKFSDEENDPEVLKQFFQQSIQEQDIQEALYLQQLIFEKVRENQIPDELIGQLKVPEESVYGPLLNNFAIFNYEENDLFLYENIRRFEQLLTILPNNPKIHYNLTALKMKAWAQGDLVTNQQEIQQSIKKLEGMGIHYSLISRLKVNYHIMLTQHYELKQDYRRKSQSLKEVYWLYKNLNLNDEDLLSLAKYLSIYSKFDWAEVVLQNRVGTVDASEELLYYYIKLTILNSNNTRKPEYRTLMQNAIDKDRQRFCELFLPTSQGGYTFQLLEDSYLQQTYCETCQ